MAPPPPVAGALGPEPQYEVIPLRGIAREVAAQLPPGARVTVTASSNTWHLVRYVLLADPYTQRAVGSDHRISRDPGHRHRQD